MFVHGRTTRLLLVIPFAALLFAACNSSTGPVVPSLGSTSTYGILASSAVTCVGPVGTVNGDVGISPGTSLTGFGSGGCTISGTQHLGDATALAAQGDLTTAYNALAGLACGKTISADLGGTTLAPGVYCSASSLGLTGALTLSGSGTYVFQAGSTLTVAGSVVLANGAQAKNVYWQVGSSASLATSSAMQGNILAQAKISLANSATLVGRALARTADVTLGASNTITQP